ncbi:MAG: glycoside hydrolase family protein, partial [Rikenellaceae bacterium]
MKILSSAIILLSVAVCSCTTAAPKPEAQLCFDGALQPIDSTSVFHDDRYYTWGSSPIKGEDGKYHILYARWGKEYGFLAWLTHSEVAHAVSDNPTGPFKFSDLALGVTDPARWDGYNIHNPTIKKFGDTYYLYYTGNTGDGKVNKTGFNWSHRNNQRIGVAVSKSLYGPWQQFDKPLIDVSEDPEANDALMVANPSVTQMKDGYYVI